MAQLAALGTVFPACHHSRLPKQQSKTTVTRSRGERLQLGVGAGLTGHWSSNMTASHGGRGPSGPSSHPVFLDPCPSPFPWTAFESVLLQLWAVSSSEGLLVHTLRVCLIVKSWPPHPSPPVHPRSHHHADSALTHSLARLVHSVSHAGMRMHTF